jgi:hypothetical protein
VELLVLAFIALLLIGIVLFAAFIPLVWFIAAALLFFSGLIGPGMGCLVLGAIASLIALARGN